ncbi:MAG: HD domain-containing protein [Oscillospiraceae bacterium]|nr:HD domain-containing protein [Ruminococcus sp.]MBP1565809.1 HD domain-containing protein [Oscillospiraceae bacterium]MBQ9982771.1 HD domain-containing protein [Oscillospiraceae bacterium]MBR6598720.1 HD domain-containing protein [Oscillospiraceae bacterium]
MASLVTYKYIKQNPAIMTYIRRADKVLEAIGYTEHSFAHVERVAQTASMILSELNYPERQVELVKIAGMMHDIGNVINRADHAQSGAVMAFRLLDNLSMPAEEICSIISAIGNHDEGTAAPIDEISAALIIADKTDVRRSRVRNHDLITFDIHDRVNYAVEESNVCFNENKTSLILELKIDTNISSVMEYFEIFLQRMILCKKAAQFFGLKFEMIINGTTVL